MDNKILQELEKLSEIVYNEDIPYPTIPAYRELHEKMSKIQNKLQRIIAMVRGHNDVITSEEDLRYAMGFYLDEDEEKEKFEDAFVAVREYLRAELTTNVADFIKAYLAEEKNNEN